ncbi:L,D-transpeptidase [Shinella zoogloeoides]|uniref:L,D-transpeptidase family protein n=1 Tax=Shinella zoogloeoides TaxID=352475 RepID=A0A6N8TD07_SHIZO|nr:L,D-transpeptidase [Shinella zoogloeoides]MXN98979.1 L,D-transpeptidase family protein [Shinella zoogloeoides]UEX83417.1 L,D-transpeptidase [Shinella zoogloeoides]
MKTLAIALAAGLLATAGAAVAADNANGRTEIASLSSSTQKTGWLQVLSGGKPVASEKKVAAVSRAPIARELVAFTEEAAPGTIIVDNSERRLYHVLGSGLAMKYAVSVGREGFIWTGSEKVTRKTEWPTWTPPADMRAREAKRGKVLPVSMKGGLDNPLGSRAIYLGSTIYRIHGTNQPSSLGKAQSSGCIRMANEDVEHLYAQVTAGTTVIVRD